MIYGSWDINCKRQIFFCHLGPFFCPPPHSNSPKYENIKKNEIIILYKCTKTHDHMLYFSWDVVRDGCNCYFSFLFFVLFNSCFFNSWCNSCFSFWTIFCPFTPLTAQKMKISKKWRNTWRYHHLHMCKKNYD